MQKDPVCGMTVDPQRDTAETSSYQGKTFYFCSTECKEKFDKNPAQFASKRGEPAA
jgi:P-type Cu+ transporter